MLSEMESCSTVFNEFSNFTNFKRKCFMRFTIQVYRGRVRSETVATAEVATAALNGQQINSSNGHNERGRRYKKCATHLERRHSALFDKTNLIDLRRLVCANDGSLQTPKM